MKPIAIFSSILILTCSCSLAPKASNQPQSRLPSAEQTELRFIDLSTIQNDREFVKKINFLYENRSAVISFQQLSEILFSESTQDQLSAAYQKYVQDSFGYFSADSFEAWLSKKKPKFFSSLTRYIDPQSELDTAGGQPIWETVNGKLRKKQTLSTHEKQFVEDLTKTLKFLPPVKGLVFRGQSFSARDISELEEKRIVPFLSFISTSLDPNVALRFSKFSEAPRADGRYATILIIQTQNGSAISAYYPENTLEYEVLISKETRFEFVRKVIDEQSKKAFIFLKTAN